MGLRDALRRFIRSPMLLASAATLQFWLLKSNMYFRHLCSPLMIGQLEAAIAGFKYDAF